MGKFVKGLAVTLLAAGVAGVAGVSIVQAQAANNLARMSFFITSKGSGKGADLGGVGGADAHCGTLAAVAGAPRNKIWRAYLSVAAIDGRTTPIHARDRIGTGPWYNAKGVQVASSVDDLHSDNNKLGKENSLTESGATVPGRGDTPNQHDILTGSDGQGRLAAVPAPAANATAPAPTNMTCNNWTFLAGTAEVGGGPCVVRGSGHSRGQGSIKKLSRETRLCFA
jgi:hypothetical protein